MKTEQKIIAIAVAAALVSGCSTKPRNFAPTLTAPVDHSARLEQDVRICDTLVKQGRTGDFAAAAATMATTGVATVGSGVAMVSTGVVGIGSSGAGAAAATFAMPIVGFIAGFGISRAIRGGKERKYKARMETCLDELGYSTQGWQKIAKRGDPGLEAGRLATFSAAEPEVETSDMAEQADAAGIEQAVLIEVDGEESPAQVEQAAIIPAAIGPGTALPQ